MKGKQAIGRAELIRQIEKYIRLSPIQRTWSTESLRIVLQTYQEP